MSDSELPERVRQFISEHIDSVAKLELLLWLLRTSGHACTVASASRELRSSDSWVAESLRELVQSGLLRMHPGTPPTFEYGPSRQDMDEDAKSLAQAYGLRPLRVIDSIYRRPTDKVQVFADAFRIRRGKKDE